MTAEQSSTQSGDRKLSDVERNRILDQAINSRDRPVISGMNFLVIHEPKITIDRSTCSADMQWGKWITDPTMVVLLAVLSAVTCGLFLPIWFFWSLRPNKFHQTIFIDENGLQHWGIAPIPTAQRVLSVAIAIGIVWWIIYSINLWHSVQMQ
jgi:hypothetical protein